MPVYEYQCGTCGVRFERTQSFKDEPIKVCPECGGKTHRVIGATGVIFKGSGFYINDSKGKSASVAPAKNGEAKTGEAGEPAKTETAAAKTDAKTEAKSDASTPAASSTAAPAATKSE